MMVNWREAVLEKICCAEKGVTKNQIYSHATKNGKIKKDAVYELIDQLEEWGAIEAYKSGSQKKYRIGKQKNKKETAEPSAVVFGHRISLGKLQKASRDAVRRKTYTTDEIHVQDYIPDKKEDNLMVKIALLDHIEEQARLSHPDASITRKNKLTLEVN